MTDTDAAQAATAAQLATVTQQRDTLAAHIRAIAVAWPVGLGETYQAIKAAVEAAEEIGDQ